MTAAIQPAKTFGLVLSASSLKGDKVVNHQGEDLGKIEELMIDLDRGRLAFAVLSFGGFLGMGDKLFAIPWQAFAVDTAQKRLILNAQKELLEKATGFDKSNWPNMADPAWGATLYGYCGQKGKRWVYRQLLMDPKWKSRLTKVSLHPDIPRGGEI